MTQDTLTEIPARQALLPEALRLLPEPPAWLAEYAQSYRELLRARPELAPTGAATDVLCPCCGSELACFDRFRHNAGQPWRENARCPVCGTLERHRHLWVRLCRESALFGEPGSLLHLAPEPFLHQVFPTCPQLRYVDCDIQSERAGSSVEVMALPFADASFRWALCCHVLEHVDDDAKALAELHRVLQPGGTAWIMVPILKAGTLRLHPPLGGFRPDDHRRGYGPEDFLALVLGAGFVPELLSVKELPPEQRARMRLSNPVYRCVRPAP